MPNLHELEAAIPVAPLKIVATESAVRMADSVNRYLIEFRKRSIILPKMTLLSRVMWKTIILPKHRAPALAPAKARASLWNPSADKIFFSRGCLQPQHYLSNERIYQS